MTGAHGGADALAVGWAARDVLLLQPDAGELVADVGRVERGRRVVDGDGAPRAPRSPA